jgi:hypothetical protein
VVEPSVQEPAVMTEAMQVGKAARCISSDSVNDLLG